MSKLVLMWLTAMVASGCSLLHPFKDPNAGSTDGGFQGGPHDMGTADMVAVPASTATGTAPTQGSLRGVVVDAVSHAPIAGAQLTAGGQTVASGSDGGFTLILPSGRATLSASIANYVPWIGNAGVGETALPFRVKLFPKAAAQMVPPAGGTIMAGSASITFPAGAYASNTSVSATLIDRVHVGSMSGVPQFIDDNGVAQRAFAQIHVEVGAEPSIPVTLVMPAPANVPASRLLLWEKGVDGKRSNPRAPSSVSNGFATYSVGHFSDEEETSAPVESDSQQLPAGDSPSTTEFAGQLVTDAPDATTMVTYTDASGGIYTGQIAEGDVYAVTSKFVLNSGDGQTLRVAHSDGSESTILGGTKVVVTKACSDAMCTTSYQQLLVINGVVRMIDNGPLNPATRIKVRTQSCGIGVQGTTYTVSDWSCLDPSHDVTRVEVTEGAVDVTGPDNNVTSLTSGQNVTICKNCATSAPAACPSIDCGNSMVSLFAGNLAVAGDLDGPFGSSLFDDASPFHVLSPLIDGNGIVYLLGTTTGCLDIRKIGTDGSISRVPTGLCPMRTNPNEPSYYLSLTLDHSDNLYFGMFGAMAPPSAQLFRIDAQGQSAPFGGPLTYESTVIGFDAAGAAYYQVQSPPKLMKQVPGGAQLNFSGNGMSASIDGTATTASYAGLVYSFGLPPMVAATGDVYVVDFDGPKMMSHIRHVAPDGSVNTIRSASLEELVFLDEAAGVLWLFETVGGSTNQWVKLSTAGQVLKTYSVMTPLNAYCPPEPFGRLVNGARYLFYSSAVLKVVAK